MSGERVSRTAVLVLCAFIIGGPAAIVLGSDYITNGSGQTKHTHVDTYGVNNSVGSSDTGLRDRIVEARQNWDAVGDAKDTIRLENEGTRANADMVLDRDSQGNNGVRVAIVSASTDSNGHYDAHPVAWFNSHYSNGMTASEKRGQACNAIGNMMGLDDAESTRDDCMEAPGTYDTLGATTKNHLDSYYGPNVELTGSAKAAQTANGFLEATDTYTVDSSATGHAMAKAQILVDGHVLQTGTVTSPCQGRCQRSTTLVAPPTDWGLGQDLLGVHTLEARGVNEFGLAGGTDPEDIGKDQMTVVIADTKTPTAKVDSGPSGATAARRPTFGFSANEGGVEFSCSLDTGTPSFGPCSGASQHQPTSDLSDGNYIFRVRATDLANHSHTATREFSVDGLPPSTSIEEAPSGSADSDQAFFEFSASEASSFRCSLDGEPFSVCASPKAYEDLDDGDHVFAVFAVDGAGNADPSPAEVEWSVSVPPASGYPGKALAQDHVSEAAEALAARGGVTIPDLGCGAVCEEFVDAEGNPLHTNVSDDELNRWLRNGRTKVGVLPKLKAIGGITLTLEQGAEIYWRLGDATHDRILTIEQLTSAPATPACAPGCPQKAVWVDQGDQIGQGFQGQGGFEAPADGLQWYWQHSSSSWFSYRLVPDSEPTCNDHPSVPDDFIVIRGIQDGWCTPGKSYEIGFVPDTALKVPRPIEDYTGQPYDYRTQTWPEAPATVAELEDRVAALLDDDDYADVGQMLASLLAHGLVPDPRATQEEEDHACDRGTGPTYDNSGGNDDPDEFTVRESTPFPVATRPSGAGSAPVYLRWGRTKWFPAFQPNEFPFIDAWDGWGFRKIRAKHGWTSLDRQETRWVLAHDHNPDPSTGGYLYKGEVPVRGRGGVKCERNVVVDYEGSPARGIVTSFNAVVD